MSLTALRTAKTAHQRALEAMHPGVITLAGRNYTGAVQVDAVQVRQNAEGTGLQRLQSLSASVLKTRLSAAPAIGDTLTFDGITWRIGDVAGHDPCEVAWQISARRFLTA